MEEIKSITTYLDAATGRKLKGTWTAEFFQGTEVGKFHFGKHIFPYRKPILKNGTKIYFIDPVAEMIGKVYVTSGRVFVENNNYYVNFGGSCGILEFAKDSRKCWVMTSAWNIKAEKELEKCLIK